MNLEYRMEIHTRIFTYFSPHFTNFQYHKLRFLALTSGHGFKKQKIIETRISPRIILFSRRTILFGLI